MNNDSQKTLHRIEQNDVSCQAIKLGTSDFYCVFKSSDASHYSRLGAAIGNNTHLETLVVAFDDEDSWTWQAMNSSMASNEIHLSIT